MNKLKKYPPLDWYWMCSRTELPNQEYFDNLNKVLGRLR